MQKIRVIPHLSFNGECEAAFKLYEQCFDGNITLMLTYGESPMAATYPQLADKIVHATIKIADHTLTGADAMPGQYQKPQGFAVQLNIETAEDSERVFNTLAHGGIVHLPLQQTFWSTRYGLVTDPFGTPWEINCAPAA